MGTDKKTKIVVDVAEPGQSAANPTARPLITNRGAPMEDPMMSVPGAPVVSPKASPKAVPTPEAAQLQEPPTTDKTAASTAELSSASRVTITPLASSDVADKPATAIADPSPPPVSDNAIVDAVVNQTANSKKGESTDEDEAAVKSIDEAIANKKYYVHVSEPPAVRRFEHTLIFILLLLLLALIAFNFALDAELLNTPIQPITNFIK